jgi:serralysin
MEVDLFELFPQSASSQCACANCAGQSATSPNSTVTIPEPEPQGLGGPTAWTTILAGTTNYRWNAAVAVGTPTFVTYSFMDSLPTYASPATFPGFVAMAAAQRDGVRAALQAWSAVSGIVFLETASGQGDMRFGTHDFSTTGNAQFSGYAYYPYESASYLGYTPSVTGDVFVNTVRYGATETFMSGGGRSLMLHERKHDVA